MPRDAPATPCGDPPTHWIVRDARGAAAGTVIASEAPPLRRPHFRAYLNRCDSRDVVLVGLFGDFDDAVDRVLRCYASEAFLERCRARAARGEAG